MTASAGFGQGATVFAAASLRAPLEQLSQDWPGSLRLSVAASSTLARQIEFGAPVDLYLSANSAWADYVAALDPAARAVPFLGNALVLAGRPGAAPVDWTLAGLEQARAGGRLAVPLIDAVPLGQYTKAALSGSGYLDAMRPHLAETDNAATARALLQTGTVQAAFLYQSDLHGTALSILHVIDPALYPTVTYVAVPLSPAGTAFLDHLTTPQARQVFASYGFSDVE